MFQKVKTCLGGIGRLIRIYITDKNTEENKAFRLYQQEKNYWKKKSEELEKRHNQVLELSKKSDASIGWTISNGRRSFKLETLAPAELLTIHADDELDLKDLHFDPNEVITEESIYSLEIDYWCLWRAQEEPDKDSDIQYCRLRHHAKAPDEGHYSLLPTKDFTKSLRNISTEYQQRILRAISEISANPFFAHGNTVKPLSHQEGLWRKRVGDYRIVYSPVKKENTVMLLKVAHRSAVYQGY
jgi:mRNA interferase RelE/StbE